MCALKLLTQQGNQATYIKILFKANESNATIYDENMGKMQAYLKECDAFAEPRNLNKF